MPAPSRIHDGGVRVRFSRGEPDRYGPILYGSRPAPFDVNEALAALRKYQTFAHVVPLEAS